MTRLHGHIPERFDGVMWSSVQVPALTSQVITLTRTAAPSEVRRWLDHHDLRGVKDSFGALDLSNAGWDVLFEAQWIARAPDAPVPRHGALRWDAIPSPTHPRWRSWTQAWSDAHEGVNVDPLRYFKWAPDVTFLAGALRGSEAVDALAIAFQTEGTVGLWHALPIRASIEDLWPSLIHAVSTRVPRALVVGYERGASLEQAVKAGASPVGPLTVWVRYPP